MGTGVRTRSLRNRRLPAALQTTLAETTRAAAQLRDKWWIIGSAAMALSGIDTDVMDVDLFVTAADARRLIGRWAWVEYKREGAEQFKSLFAMHRRTPIPIEIMGGLTVCQGGIWTPVHVSTRVSVETDDGVLFVPTLAEQLSLLELFGRPKDRRRAEAIRRALVHPPSI